MMKSRFSCPLLLCLVLLFSAQQLPATPVNVDSALRVASARLALLPGSSRFQIKEITAFTDAQLRLYICRTTPGGYLVVSGDTELPPVVAFSLDNDFGEISVKRNPLLSLLVADLQLRWDNLELLPAETRNERLQQWEQLLTGSPGEQDERPEDWWPPAGSTPTGGWIETNWTQSHPYNAFCPIDQESGNRSFAGCPSVAMAQILNFHRNINSTRLNDWDDYHHNYAGNNFWIDDDYEEYQFPSFPMLNGYLDSLEAHWDHELPLTIDDKAALVFACGVACQQVYNPAGSGTFGVIQAYNAFLRFNHPEVRLLDEDDADLYTSMMQNMMDALPVHFAIVTPQWDMGHNVVVDGYNSDDYYHLNFGWGGSFNGWYLLPDEIPYGLTVVEGAICDIGCEPEVVWESPIQIAAWELRCYPNPCNPVTAICFRLDKADNIALSIYDLQGRLVWKLAAGTLGAGEHTIRWEPAVASGLYFARLSNGTFFEVAKVCVLR
ncbi:C10 family peptidase [bacterium]|nr:C10 family peptidase [bacterium]